MNRDTKDEYYLSIAAEVAKRSTCLRRQYGAVIVKNDEIIATGYNGAARGQRNCCDEGTCWREAHGIPHGKEYERCVAVHAEANAIISASRNEMIDATLYLSGWENGHPIDAQPCFMCARMIRNAGIASVQNRKGTVNLDKIMEQSLMTIETNADKTLKDLQNKFVFFDLDGTLSELKFGTDTVLAYPETPGKNYYENVRPLENMQHIINKLNPNKVFVITDAWSEPEKTNKINWLAKHYGTIKQENVFFTNPKIKNETKQDTLLKWMMENNIAASNVAVIEDNINNIAKIEDAIKHIHCIHTSSFVD